MNWTKIAIGGLAGGIVIWLVDFLAHGFLLADTYYTGVPLFDVAPVNPLKFVLLSICTAVAAGMLFARTRNSWTAGAGGGATFGFFVGLVGIFTFFYNPLVINGFAQSLAFWWAAVGMVDAVVLGAILGVVLPRTD